MKIEQRVVAAAIPKRYIHCTIKNFHDLDAISLRKAKERVLEFADCWPASDPGKGLLLMGGCGVGKTHLAVAMLQEIIHTNKPGKLLFSNFQDLIQEIHASFESEDSPGKAAILQPILAADLLVLDELGSVKPTSFVQDTMYYVINSRYNDEKVTVFTTNYVDEPQGREESLEDRIGSRLRSRLWEMTERIVLAGNDYRKRTSRAI